MSAGKRQQMME